MSSFISTFNFRLRRVLKFFLVLFEASMLWPVVHCNGTKVLCDVQGEGEGVHRRWAQISLFRRRQPCAQVPRYPAAAPQCNCVHIS